MGHATRCIPIIKELLTNNIDVVIAGSGKSLDLISAEFPLLQTLTLPDYDLHFNHFIPIGLHVVLQSLKIKRKIKREKLVLDNYLAAHEIAGIISDNRYGIYSSSLPSAIVTHQIKLAPKTPFRGLANNQIKKYLHRFSEIWVPDEKGSVISGELSDTDDFTAKKYLGVLSRFKAAPKTKRENFILATLSGTEPHRTLLENRLIKSFRNSKQKITLVRGIPESQEKKIFPENFTVHNHLLTEDLEKLLTSCKLLISRCGYSTILDAMASETPVLLVATKGQSEQEYLSRRLESKFNVPLLKEKQISEDNLQLAQKISCTSENLLSSVIGKWVNQL